MHAIELCYNWEYLIFICLVKEWYQTIRIHDTRLMIEGALWRRSHNMPLSYLYLETWMGISDFEKK